MVCSDINANHVAKKFTKLTNTILEKSPWSWNVWTKVLYEMLHFSSVDLIMNTLINEHYVVELTTPHRKQ